MTPATRTIASTSHNKDGDVGVKLISMEENLAQVKRALQIMVIMNQGMNGNGRIQNQNQFTRMTKVEFLKFSGDDVKGILQRFGTVFDDLINEIRKIKYQSNAKEYQDAFDTLLSRVDVSKEHAVSYYLGGFPTEIEMGVRMFRPKTLADAYQLTNIQEATLEAIKKKNKAMVNSQQGRFVGGSNGYWNNVKPSLLPLTSSNSNWRSTQNTLASGPIRKQMTQKEYQEKRAQNFCFYCD
ncbi:hypothetical protein Tco_0162640 [Tanacetum coccineum]